MGVVYYEQIEPQVRQSVVNVSRNNHFEEKMFKQNPKGQVLFNVTLLQVTRSVD